MKPIILFDGICNFCHSSIQFIIKRDPNAYFLFSSLQSDIGQSLLKQNKIPFTMDSMILIENGKVYDKSSAVLRICKNLSGLWKYMYIFVIIPLPIRDLIYNIVAKNRYKWFGKKDTCILPNHEIRKRFLS
ncbi:thiol-disulfide oxidoreductase DCC family protein [Lederbergia lenta]|uniref:Thiol-disulfide oxidoreductase DCC n=1 Tax=Lederbergia lenta TaxID=1467 RepID=A0A2X4WU42_LEDLE|nr:thiol-disulfide oxidoreductase DCC family protein [Lederbergia lenta]MCM3110565.1 thiol-disulfide oxidoreductase DCC family protein [Lederbergia lenta]MEC2323869.1 thiol-disulfide oxidoreductase DCC family protein [Lederbergia lenta]SQI61170.1 thiol-disulfide oxidoreductase DCC [Lederbergia lenta]